MYAQLGSIRFEALKGFSGFTDSRATNYAEIARVNRKPNLQRVGEQLQAISISILLHADFSDIESDMEQFEQLRKQGESVPLILGNGNVLGDFLILSISRNIRKTASDGTIIYLTADIEIKEYQNGDRLESVAITAKQNAFATSIEKIVPSRELQVLPSEGVLAGGLATSIDIEAFNIDAEVQKASSNIGARPTLFESITARADASSIAALELANKVRALREQISNAEQIIENAERLSTLAGNINAAIANADIDQLLASNSSFQASASTLSNSASIIVQLIAARKI